MERRDVRRTKVLPPAIVLRRVESRQIWENFGWIVILVPQKIRMVFVDQGKVFVFLKHDCQRYCQRMQIRHLIFRLRPLGLLKCPNALDLIKNGRNQVNKAPK